jgi:hypothetical protein
MRGPARSSGAASAILALAGLAACGSPPPDAADAACSLKVPASCLSPAPSYRTDIQPIVDRSCGPCHLPGGVSAAKHDFSTYAGIYSQRGTVLGFVSTCAMPLAGAPPLPHADGETLLDWLTCGAPQN